MARKPQGYFERRSTELMLRLEKGTENTIKSLIQAYEQTTKNINKEIENIFKNFAKDTGLDKKTLLQLLNKKETEQYYKNLLEVINNNITNESIKKRLLAKYNAPAYSYRISRYQALQDNIDVELKKLANIEQNVTKIRYVDTINEAYYHNIYDIQKGTGLGFSFAQIDNRTINLMLNGNWTNNANFSKRIWNNSEKLGNYLRTNLTADTMTGKSIQKISKELADYMNVGLYNATRLVRTEVNHFANEAEMLAYKELDIERYRFIATLDKRTCKHCGELDNKVFNVKDKIPGKNYPPIHSNDRCTTVAVFDDEVTEGLTRRARDENGKSILVPQDMNYQQWKEKYVTNNNNGGIILTNKEQNAINKYISSDFYKINEKLRNGMELNNEEVNLVNDLDKTLNKMPTYNGLVSRSLQLDKEQLEQFLKSCKIGEEIKYKAYTSTTAGDRYNDLSNVELYINSKNGKDIRRYNEEEQEILFKRNSLFKVKQIEKIKNTYHILLEDLNGKG